MSRETPVKFLARNAWEYDAIELFAKHGKAWAEPPTFVEQPDHLLDVRLQPLMRLTMDEAQALANQLWDAGIRPVGAAGSAGQLAAVERHLQDMQRLVFDCPRSIGKGAL